MNRIKKTIITVCLIGISTLSIFGRPFGPRPHYRGCPPPPPPHHRVHFGGEWAAVGGIAYLAGTVIRAASDTPRTTIIYTRPQTVVVQPTVVETQTTPTTVVVENPTVLSKSGLQTEITSMLSQNLKNIPFCIDVEDFYSAGDKYGASITATVSLGGKNYKISSGGTQPTYAALKDYLVSEITKAVSSIASTDSGKTTITQIK